MVGIDSHEVSRVSCYLGRQPPCHLLFAYRIITFFDRPFQAVRLNRRLITRRPLCKKARRTPQPPAQNAYRLNCARFRLFPFRSPLLRESLRFLFLRVLRCFTSPGFASRTYEFSAGSHGMTRVELPHSEILGSKQVCSFPRLIAAYRVLHRHTAPSHPPYALRSLTYDTWINGLY